MVVSVTRPLDSEEAVVSVKVDGLSRFVHPFGGPGKRRHSVLGNKVEATLGQHNYLVSFFVWYTNN